MPVSVRELRERIRAREEEIFQKWIKQIDVMLSENFDGKGFNFSHDKKTLQLEFIFSERDMVAIPLSNIVNHVVSVYTSYGQGWNVQTSTVRAYDELDDSKVTFTFSVAEKTAEQVKGGTP